MSDTTEQRLLNSAIRKLSYRSQSVGEMRTFLSRKTESEADVEKVIVRLQEMDLLDDEKFAHEWVRARINKGKGERVISFELKKKLVEHDLIHTAVSEVDDEGWIESAKQVLKKKKSSFKSLNTYQKSMKMKQILYKRGFSSSTISAAIDDLGSEGVE